MTNLPLNSYSGNEGPHLTKFTLWTFATIVATATNSLKTSINFYCRSYSLFIAFNSTDSTVLAVTLQSVASMKPYFDHPNIFVI